MSTVPSTDDVYFAHDDHGKSVGLPLFHDLLLRAYLYHCVWSVITAHNLTPEKRGPTLYSPLRASETTFNL